MISMRAVLALMLLATGVFPLLARDNACNANVPTPDGSASMFTPEQEVQLGDVLAAQLPSSLRVTADPALTAYLDSIGERVAAHLSGSRIKFRYFVIDSPFPNAFAVAGGRIYIFRGLSAFVRNEDELAGILAHEMGHIVAHQTAIALTTQFRNVLGLTSVSSRDEIVLDLNRLKEALQKNPSAVKRAGAKDEQEQSAADEIAFYAAVSAGYSAQSMADVFDRIAQTSKKTGNFFTDLLGLTTPDERRLRSLIRLARDLPASCISTRKTAGTTEFDRWKTAVLEFSDWKQRAEQVHGVLSKIKLDKISLSDVSHLRFSPNGKYIMAREAGQIYIFGHEPLVFLFQVPANEDTQAIFTADSARIILTTPLPHIELWDIAGQTRTQSFNLLERRCLLLALSPQADALGCVGQDGTLALLNLPSGAEKFEKKHFSSANWLAIVGHTIEFSPDGRYFVVTGTGEQIAYDLSTGRMLKLPAPLSDRLQRGFVFLDSSRVMVRDVTFLGVAGIFSFPGGKLLDTIPIGPHLFFTPTRGDYALLYPHEKYAIAVMNLKTKRIVTALEQKTVDIYGDEYVRELADGDLGLFDVHSLQLNKHVAFPADDSHGFTRAFASLDLNWIAGCGLQRCALWSASTGKRILLLKPFNNAWFDGGEAMYADFAKFRNDPRCLGRIDLHNLASASSQPIDARYAEMMGGLLIIARPASPGPKTQEAGEGIPRGYFQSSHGFAACGKFANLPATDCNTTFEFHDVITGAPLWSRHFAKETPAISVAPDEKLVLLRWNAAVPAAQDEMKSYPALIAELAATKEHKDFALIEIVDARTGRPHQALLVNDAPVIWVLGGRRLALHERYFEIFSMNGARKEGELVGVPVAYSSTNGVVVVRTEEPGVVQLYDLATRAKMDEFVFPENVALVRFNSDGKRLLVVLHDQTAYTLQISVALPARPSAQN
jgi:WD40 repeat protein